MGTGKEEREKEMIDKEFREVLRAKIIMVLADIYFETTADYEQVVEDLMIAIVPLFELPREAW